jgi:hypothetical protein
MNAREVLQTLARMKFLRELQESIEELNPWPSP